MCAHGLSMTPQDCGATNSSCSRDLDLELSELQSTYDFFNSHRHGMMGTSLDLQVGLISNLQSLIYFEQLFGAPHIKPKQVVK